jgi:iron complex outermembrane recepter protein
VQEFNSRQVLLEIVPDATQVNAANVALIRFGGNAQLEAERSTDREVDLTIAPESLPGASLRIGYFNISYHQRIGVPTLDITDPLSDPSTWPFVLRNPSQASIAAALSQASFTDQTAGTYTAQDATVVVDDRNQNFVRQNARGVDVLGKLGWDAASGKWDLSVNTAYLKLRQQITYGTAMVPLSGKAYYPPRWRGRFGASWSCEPYLASVFVNYTGGSRATSVPGLTPATAQGIASWTTLDGQIGMSFEGDRHWGRTQLTLSAQNLLNRRPPLIRGVMLPGVAGVNYDSTNSSPVGRFVTLQLTQAW